MKSNIGTFDTAKGIRMNSQIYKRGQNRFAPQRYLKNIFQVSTEYYAYADLNFEVHFMNKSFWGHFFGYRNNGVSNFKMCRIYRLRTVCRVLDLDQMLPELRGSWD